MRLLSLVAGYILLSFCLSSSPEATCSVVDSTAILELCLECHSRTPNFEFYIAALSLSPYPSVQFSVSCVVPSSSLAASQQHVSLRSSSDCHSAFSIFGSPSPGSVSPAPFASLLAATLPPPSTPSDVSALSLWCASVLVNDGTWSFSYPDVTSLASFLTLCNANDEGRRYRPVLGEISSDSARSGGLSPFIDANYPCLIRSPSPPAGSSGSPPSPWSLPSLLSLYKDEPVTALVYDSAPDVVSEAISAVDMTLGAFAELALGGFEIAAGTQMTAPSLYFLLTTRRHETRPTVNPNHDKAPGIRSLLGSAVPFDDAFFNSASSSSSSHNRAPLLEAWSNVRLGVGYDYPTHIDCFENVIVQLQGRKRVVLHRPDAAEAFRPSPGRKHWPTTTGEERGRPPLKDVVEENRVGDANLGEGEALYVPVMWLHSVHVDEKAMWSATANRYYYGVEGGAKDWEGVMQRKKSAKFLKYEREHEKLC